MKNKSYFIFRNGQAEGPFSKTELELAVCKNEINPDILYSYDRAKNWYPLTRLIGDPSKLNIQAIEDNIKKYFVFSGNQNKGPFSYNELKEMLKKREIFHQTHFSVSGSDKWNSLAKLPLPRIPKNEKPDGVQTKEEWEKSKSTLLGIFDELKLTKKIGVYWTDDDYYIWIKHSPKSSVSDQMFMSGPIQLDYLKKPLLKGEIQNETPCAKSGTNEWLTVRDFL